MADFGKCWFEFDDAVYLNTSAEGLMPRPAIQAAQAAVEAKTFPHRVPASSMFELPDRLRASIAKLIGGQADEIALTTGASAGTAILAYNLPWKTGDEVITPAGEFPLQYTTWGPLAAREGVTLRVVKPSGPFLSADDLIGALSSRTRLVSVSLVRFDDGSLLDAARLAAACHAQGTLLSLDVSQCCGGMPLDVARLGADFLTAAGYKWLLSPYGTGFFWCRGEHLDLLRPGPFYWMATEGAGDFSALRFADPTPAARASRWDTPEWAGAWNVHLAAMAAAVAFVEEVGPAVVKAHNDGLIDRMFERLPEDLVRPASPREALARGPYGCFRADSVERTKAVYDALTRERVLVSLREGNIRVSPHLFNTEAHIDRLVEVVTALQATPAFSR
jgi:cysteine desulfurase/selenocysteine lyase